MYHTTHFSPSLNPKGENKHWVRLFGSLSMADFDIWFSRSTMLFCCHTAALHMNATGARQPEKLFRLCWSEIGMPFVASLRLTFRSTGRSWCAVTHRDGLRAPGITGEKFVKLRCGLRTSKSAYVKHEWWYVGSLKYVKCCSEIRLKTGCKFSYPVPRAVKSILSDSGYNS